MSNFYLKRGEKAFGPLTWERLKALAESGKIGATARVSTSSNGPWKSFGDLQSEMEPQEESQPESSGVFLGGFPLDPIQPTSPTSASDTYWSAPPPSPAVSASRKYRTTDSSDLEQEEASFFARLFIPWAGENSQARYGNLDRYIKIFKFMNRFLFILGLIGIMLHVAISTIFFVFALFTSSGLFEEMSVAETMIYTIGAYLWAVLALLFLHLFYIASMALCDFLRLAMDVEANTRKRG